MISYSVEDLSTEIYQNEFDSDTGYASLSLISGWLENNVGQLNTKIYSSFYVQNSNFEPSGQFKQEERSIYKQMYLYEFYTKKTRQVLRGIDSSVDFLSLREGDTMITRTNKNELAKTYRSLASDAREEMEKLVSSYNIYQAAPVQVAGEDGSPIYTGSGYFYYPYGYGLGP